MKAIKYFLTASALITAANVANATVWDVTMHARNTYAALQGDLVMDFTGTWNDSTGAGYWAGNTHAEDSPLILNFTYNQTFTMDSTTGRGKLNPLDRTTCTDTGQECIGFAPVIQGDFYNNNTKPCTSLSCLQSYAPFSPANGSTYQWILQVYLQGIDGSGNPTMQYLAVPMQVTLHAQTPAVPIPTAAWLFGSGLIGLARAARRRNYKN